jgi:phenylacetate-CoA ligase
MYKIYAASPVFVQNLLCSAYGYKENRIRLGDWFDHWRDRIEEMEYYTEAEIDAYQNERLLKLVKRCYQHVPYYTKLFDELGLQPSDINSKEDLHKIPVTTKEDVRINIDEFTNTTLDKKKLIKRTTSGTTGKSLSFYCTEEAISFQYAVWWRHRSRFGFNPGDKHLNFTSKLVVPEGQKKPPYWRWNKASNQAIVNMQVIDDQNIPHILDFISKNRFDYWIGYPSIIHEFCAKVLDRGYSLDHKPKGIFFGAENVLEGQRQDISELTGATLTDVYGFMEGCGNASQCREFKHHADFEYGIMECLNPETLDSGEVKGDIVCTGFANKAFPLLRYEVGDIGVWAPPSYECACGRHSPVLNRIEGRADDYVITPEGRKVMRFSYIFRETPEIREAQVVQKKRGQVTINIVPRENYSKDAEEHLKEMVAAWISPELAVNFEYLKDIPREENGKFRAVKSLLNGTD